jgi:hypothetical protein
MHQFLILMAIQSWDILHIPTPCIPFDTALKDLTEKASPHSPLEEAVMNKLKVLWLPPSPSMHRPIMCLC